MDEYDSLSSVLTVISSRLPTNLFSASTLSSLTSVGQLVPRSVTPVFGFESSLADSKANADLLTYHNSKSGAGNFLRQLDGTPTNLRTGSNWQIIKRFATSWQQDNVLQQGIDDIWLEFDVDPSASELPEPSLFFGPKLFQYDDKYTNQQLKQHLFRLISAGLQPLYTNGMPQAEQSLLRQLVESLPDYGRIFQVGKMLSRQTNGFRLCLDNLSATEVHQLCANFSDNQVWLDSVRYWLDQLTPFAWKIRPAIDLSDRLLPKIGLECSFRNGPDEQPLAYWHEFVNYLVSNNLCTDSKANALLCYPGVVRSDPDDNRWPLGLKTAEALIGKQRQSAFVLTLHHIKLTIAHGMLPVAKAYMAVEHQWLTRKTNPSMPEKWEKDSTSL